MRLRDRIIFLTIFGIAMGYLESAVVIYLRGIYYTDGFKFPLRIISPQIFLTEILREIATIVMLITISYTTGRNFKQRFAIFIYNFAIWDIFFYIWLKALIGWPETLLTWDILFLIPITWIGPVLAPIICSFTMVTLGLLILMFDERGYKVKMKPLSWGLILSGAFIIFITFIWDYSMIIIKGGFLPKLVNLSKNPEFITAISQYIPSKFNWLSFTIGELMILIAIVLIYTKTKMVKTECL
ncbi:MAG: hypothetical protein ACUVWP_06420 [bacterium]